jgi:hypothetical protein
VESRTELCLWIDQSLDLVSNKELYKIYFASINPTEYEDVIYISNYEKGIELVLTPEKVVISIHLFGKNTVDHGSFRGKIPFELNFSYSRKEVVEVLGIAHLNGGGHSDAFLGYINNWEKYIYPDLTLVIEYSNQYEKIEMLTISSLSLENALNRNNS